MSSARPEFIEYNGKNVFYLNFANMAKADVPGYMEEAKNIISTKEPGSVLFLANIHKMGFDKKTVKSFVEFFKFTKDYKKRTAVIGMDSMMKLLYEAVLKLSGRGTENIRVFDGPNAEAQAKDWLTLM